MQLNTRHFGMIEIDESRIITFGSGIPSFEDVKKYVILDSEDAESPFKWLQSIDQPALAFVVISPFFVRPDYDINIDDSTVKQLGIEKEEDVLIYSIVVVPEDISKISMNLKAPIIINSKKKKGMQVILDTDQYGVRHYILEELQGQEVNKNAGSHKEERTINRHK